MSPILRHQRHYAFANDKRNTLVDILLYAGTEGSNRRRCPAQFPNLSAQRRRQHSQDVRPRSSARSAFISPSQKWPSRLPELTARVDGWPVFITRQRVVDGRAFPLAELTGRQLG